MNDGGNDLKCGQGEECEGKCPCQGPGEQRVSTPAVILSHFCFWSRPERIPDPPVRSAGQMHVRHDFILIHQGHKNYTLNVNESYGRHQSVDTIHLKAFAANLLSVTT